ncbi:hypothetical protein CLOM_g11615 [Closterium sp. NIES-68]|nr:hypothetical protein CLOM_g11615 [Closterium sp. NIES-68]GJP58566.1 hypothetical protein CLOP_g444 [Closterium sp. NIES-67]
MTGTSPAQSTGSSSGTTGVPVSTTATGLSTFGPFPPAYANIHFTSSGIPLLSNNNSSNISNNSNSHSNFSNNNNSNSLNNWVLSFNRQICLTVHRFNGVDFYSRSFEFELLAQSAGLWPFFTGEFTYPVVGTINNQVTTYTFH